jgi:hypothetical protein
VAPKIAIALEGLGAGFTRASKSELGLSNFRVVIGGGWLNAECAIPS